MKKTIIAILALAFVCSGLGLAQAKHPSELTYPALKYEPPDPKAFRTVYAGGLRAYVQEDREPAALQHHRPSSTAATSTSRRTRPVSATVLGDQLIKGGTASRGGLGHRGPHRFPRRFAELHGRRTDLHAEPVRPGQGPRRGPGPVLRRPQESRRSARSR